MSTPTNCVTAEEKFCKHVADIVRYGFAFEGALAADDTISNVESIEIEIAEGDEESGYETLTIGDEDANDDTLSGDNGEEYAAGRAVLGTAQGGSPGVTYAVTIVVETTAGETLGGKWYVEVEA